MPSSAPRALVGTNAVRTRPCPAARAPCTTHYSLQRRGRFWEVLDPTGALVCLTVYKCGATEVIRRLQSASMSEQSEARSDSLVITPSQEDVGETTVSTCGRATPASLDSRRQTRSRHQCHTADNERCGAANRPAPHRHSRGSRIRGKLTRQ